MDNHTSNRKLGVEDTWLNGLSGISKIKNFILCDIQNNFSRPFCSLASCFRGGVKAQDPISQTNGFGQYTGLDQNVIINNDQNSANPSSQPQNQINTPARVNLLGGIENTILGVNPSPADISGNLLYGQENGINADDAKITNSVAMGLGNLLQSECEECIALGADNEISGGESTLSFGAFSRNQSERSILIGFGASSTARLQDVGTRSITLGTSNNSSNTAFKTLNIRPPSTAGNFSAPVTGIGITSPDAKLSIENTGGNSSSTILNLRDNNSNKVFTVKNNGNVGIGTPTSPVSKLQIISNGTTNSTFALNVRDANNNSLLLVRDDGWTGFRANPSAPYYFTETNFSPFTQSTSGDGKANIVQNYAAFPNFKDFGMNPNGNQAKWLALGERPPASSTTNNDQVAYGLANVWQNNAANFVLLDQDPGTSGQTAEKDLAITFQDVWDQDANSGQGAPLTHPSDAENRIRFLFRNSRDIDASQPSVFELMSLEPTGEVAVGDYSGSVSPDAKRFEVKWDEESQGNNFNNSKPIMKVLRKNPHGSGNEPILSIKDNGTVYIGPNNFPLTGSSTSDNLQLDGSAYTNGTWGPSDIRYKTDTQLIQNPLEKVNKLDGITYNYAKNQYTKNRNFRMKERHSGVVAQQLKEVLPEAVRKGHGGLYAVNYDAIIPLLIETNKTQQKQIDDQKNKIQKQQKQIEKLRAKSQKIEKLENQVSKLSNKLSKIEGRQDESAYHFKNNSTEKLNERTVTIGSKENKQQAMLLQNRPNPFSSETIIPYYLPEDFASANLLITNINGEIIKRISLKQAGKGELTVQTEGLKSGQYLYTLIVEGRKINTRKMVISSK